MGRFYAVLRNICDSGYPITERYHGQETASLRGGTILSIRFTIFSSRAWKMYSYKTPTISSECSRIAHMAFPEIISERQTIRRDHNGPNTYQWDSILLKVPKGIKQAIVSNWVHIPYVRELLNSCASINKITLKDWNHLFQQW